MRTIEIPEIVYTVHITLPLVDCPFLQGELRNYYPKSNHASKAAGPDAIPCRLLKELATELFPALTSVFRQSLVPYQRSGLKPL